ncbi:MAG: NfeD family protein, partial [Alistipes sp.]|nr:NfeD family protein [Alistipes sp.]
YLGFDRLGVVGGVVTVVAILLLSLVVTILSLRAKTWQHLALKDEIKGASMETPSVDLKVGDRGTTLSRLSPMGNVQFGAKVYEAKSLDSYIDQRQEVETVGFENFTVIVKRVN